jgi:molybdopterin converting factor subunit 1
MLAADIECRATPVNAERRGFDACEDVMPDRGEIYNSLPIASTDARRTSLIFRIFSPQEFMERSTMTVLYFGVARDRAGLSREDIDPGAELTVAELWEELIRRHPELADCRDISRMAADMEYVDDAEPIGAAREIAIIPPVAGG